MQSSTVTPRGRTVQQFYGVRATYPDGRVEDSDELVARPRDEAQAFGRHAFPHGTRFTSRGRVVTTDASDWMDEHSARAEFVRRTGADVVGRVLRTPVRVQEDKIERLPSNANPLPLSEVLTGFVVGCADAFVTMFPEAVEALRREGQLSTDVDGQGAQARRLIEAALRRLLDVG